MKKTVNKKGEDVPGLFDGHSTAYERTKTISKTLKAQREALEKDPDPLTEAGYRAELEAGRAAAAEEATVEADEAARVGGPMAT